jgi:hypothetical protein
VVKAELEFLGLKEFGEGVGIEGREGFVVVGVGGLEEETFPGGGRGAAEGGALKGGGVFLKEPAGGEFEALGLFEGEFPGEEE